MRKNLGKKWQFLPLPVVVIGTYDKNGKPNAMTAAWATVYDYGKVFASIDLGHLTAKNLKISGCFTMAFTTKNTVKISDYLGLVSGKKVDKIKKLKLKAEKASKINAPIFTKYPLVLECKIISFKEGNLIGEIVNVNIDKDYLKPNGTIDTKKMGLVVLDMATNTYKILGKEIAKAFSVGLKLK